MGIQLVHEPNPLCHIRGDHSKPHAVPLQKLRRLWRPWLGVLMCIHTPYFAREHPLARALTHKIY